MEADETKKVTRRYIKKSGATYKITLVEFGVEVTHEHGGA